MSSRYRELVSLINQFLEGETINVTEEEINRRIEKAYNNDEIEGTQYDHLNNLMY